MGTIENMKIFGVGDSSQEDEILKGA